MSTLTTPALTVTRAGGVEVLEVRETEIPNPGPGELRVQVEAAGVNFIDVYKREGIYTVPTPFVLGEEGAGTVESVGPDVSDIAAGDRVAWSSNLGSAAGLAIVSARVTVPVPIGVDGATAAGVMLQGMTAQYLACSTYPVSGGDVALVHAAAGGVGQLLVQIVGLRGGTVVATAGAADKLALALDLGAAHAIDYTAYDSPEALAEAVRAAVGRGVDVVYDGVGRATFDASLASLRARGMLVLFGGASGQVPPFDLQRLNSAGSLFVTRPTLANYIGTREELLWRSSDLFGWIADGSLRIDVSRQYPLDRARQAYTDLEGRRTTGKLLLIP